MNWPDERYVRVYTRDTTEWMLLGWEGQCVLVMMMRKADRAGIVDMGRHGPRGLAVLLGMPVDIVTRGLEGLFADGCVERHDNKLVIRNFIEAQEAVASPAQRQRVYRERERDAIRAGLPPSSQAGCVVYVIQSELGGAVKIGRADDLAKRLAGLQTGRPDRLVVLAAVQGTREDERLCHDLLEHSQERGEWFRFTPAIRALIAGMKTHDTDVWLVLRDERAQLRADVTSKKTGDVSGDVSSTGDVTRSSAVTPSVPSVPSRAEEEKEKNPSLPPSTEQQKPKPDLKVIEGEGIRADPNPATVGRPSRSLPPDRGARGSWTTIGTLPVYDAWLRLYAPKGSRSAPTFDEDRIITGALDREGGDEAALIRILRSLEGHRHEDPANPFRMLPTNAGHRSLTSLLKSDAVVAGLSLMEAHESGADKPQKKSDPTSRPAPLFEPANHVRASGTPEELRARRQALLATPQAEGGSR